MQSLRPGDWKIENVGGSRAEYQIAKYEPYTHLDDLANAIEKDPMLSAVLGNSYQISPDVIVTSSPEAGSAMPSPRAAFRKVLPADAILSENVAVFSR